MNKAFKIPFSNATQIFIDLHAVVGLQLLKVWADVQVGVLSNTCPDLRSFAHWKLEVMLSSGHSVYSKLFREHEDAMSLLNDARKRINER